jgi:hypothetical protein
MPLAGAWGEAGLAPERQVPDEPFGADYCMRGSWLYKTTGGGSPTPADSKTQFPFTASSNHLARNLILFYCESHQTHTEPFPTFHTVVVKIKLVEIGLAVGDS